MEQPFNIPLGQLVERPQWAVERYAYEDGVSDYLKDSRDVVESLRREIGGK